MSGLAEHSAGWCPTWPHDHGEDCHERCPQCHGKPGRGTSPACTCSASAFTGRFHIATCPCSPHYRAPDAGRVCSAEHPWRDTASWRCHLPVGHEGEHRVTVNGGSYKWANSLTAPARGSS